MNFTLDYATLAKKLECQELESPTGRASAQVYGQLLAIYILFNDLVSAKFLWKRIPNDIKESNGELSLIWQIGKLMWKKDYSDIYPVMNSCPVWPNHLKNIMALILESTRQRVIKLISKAYSNISLEDASTTLGLTKEEVLKLAADLNWRHDKQADYLTIVNPPKCQSKSVTSLENGNELLKKLSDYISFLHRDNV